MNTIVIRTNTITRQNFDEFGIPFEGGPVFPYKSHLRVEWHLYTGTPGAGQDSVDVSTWIPDKDFAGCGALLTCDNDFLLRMNGKTVPNIPSGTTVDEISISIPSFTFGILPERGFLRVIDETGESQNLIYSSFAKDENVIIFNLASAYTFPNGVPDGSPVFVSQNTYFQSVNKPDLSVTENGVFVFDIVVYSEKLAQTAEVSSSRFITIQGVELLPYDVDSNNIYSERQSFLCDSALLCINLGEAGTPVNVPDVVENELAAMIAAQADLLGATVEIGNVTTAEYGEEPSVTNTGTNRNAIFDMKLPKGDKGDRSTIRIGNVQTGTTAGVVNTGTETDAVLSFVIPEGKQGPAGTITIGSVTSGEEASIVNTGTESNAVWQIVMPRGDAATISIGSVTSGETASIVNVGTENAAVWNVTLPKGAKGDDFEFDARDQLSNKGQYDGEAKGFIFLAIDTAEYYIKQSDSSGDWSEAFPFPGVAPTIEVGSVASGDTASVTNSGTPTHATLDFVLPKGEKGEKGDVGDAAGFGVFTVTVTSLEPDATASGTIETSGDNAAKNVFLKLNIPKGEKGDGFEFDGYGTLAERALFDLEKKGFTFLCDDGTFFIKQSDSFGDWSDPLPFKGEAGAAGAIRNEIKSLTGGKMFVSGAPSLIQTNSGNVYPVSAGFVTASGDGFYIDPAPYLLADGQASFTGTWIIYTVNVGD